MKDRTLKLIFAVSLVTAVILPLISIHYIYPAFTKQLVSNTENEAIRTGKHLARMYFNNTSEITAENINDKFIIGANYLMYDYGLMKIKVFSASGETVFSTQNTDIGKINNKTYFNEIIAQGKPYTKVVKKNTMSLEGQKVTADVVETYVPIINTGKLAGAFVLYYDISTRLDNLNRLVLYASIVPLLLMFVFLLAIVIIIARSTKGKDVPAFARNKIRYRSPHISMLIITLSIIIFEAIAMVIIHSITFLSDVEQTLLDVLILVAFSTPTIYFILVQPLMKYIAELRAAERELKESQDILVNEHGNLNKVFSQVENAKLEWEKTVDRVSDIIIRTDKDGRITRFNKALKEMAGKEYTEIVGCNWEDFIDDCNMEVTTLLDTSIELHQKSTGHWYVLNSYPFYDREQHFAGNVITINNNTEIKKMSEELESSNKQLEESKKKLTSALDEVSGLINNVTHEKKFNVRFSNPNLNICHEIKKCDKQDCISHVKESVRCWQEAGTFCGGEVQGQFAQKYGNCSDCEVFKMATSDPIYQIGEQFNNMMHVLEQKNIELEDAYKDLKETQSQMLQREKMASIGQLAAGVAHEINNPMGFISSNMNSLGKYTKKIVDFINIQEKAIMSANSPALTEEMETHKKKLKLDFILGDIDQLLEESLDGADRVKKIVQNLKSFSRIDESEHNLANINECIESTLQIVWNELKYKATVTKEYGDIPLTMCYPQQLNQVFVNLFVNASHAIEKQGEIKIKTWNGSDMVNISVSDTGSGIEKEKIEKIFEPFFTTKPVGKGTGLGLSITYDIIKKHNGFIAVDSEVGKGTTFHITIPVTGREKDE